MDGTNVTPLNAAIGEIKLCLLADRKSSATWERNLVVLQSPFCGSSGVEC